MSFPVSGSRYERLLTPCATPLVSMVATFRTDDVRWSWMGSGWSALLDDVYILVIDLPGKASITHRYTRNR